ncbi:MAG TPA: hypothetical protein VKX17_20575 [Planctomycetota bacterium]|nr:hypothetical protein [Planctomycetota bacterium]
MKSRTVPDFWVQFRQLPPEIQRKAHKAYLLWRANPSATGLRFKRVNDEEPIYSVRINRGYRALGLLEGDTIYWYFIGNHGDYERELKKL